MILTHAKAESLEWKNVWRETINTLLKRSLEKEKIELEILNKADSH